MDLKKGIIPVTELKNHTKEILARVMKSGDPMLVTQNGHSAVMILDVGAYQTQQKKLYLLEAISKGEREIMEGKGISHSDVQKRAASW
jgi:prevent-host-death family protein